MHGAHQQIHHDFVLNISGRKSKISDWGPRISDTRSKIPDNNWLITDHGSRVLICDTFQLHNEILSWPWSSNPYRIALSPNADRAIDTVFFSAISSLNDGYRSQRMFAPQMGTRLSFVYNPNLLLAHLIWKLYYRLRVVGFNIVIAPSDRMSQYIFPITITPRLKVKNWLHKPSHTILTGETAPLQQSPPFIRQFVLIWSAFCSYI